MRYFQLKTNIRSLRGSIIRSSGSDLTNDYHEEIFERDTKVWKKTNVLDMIFGGFVDDSYGKTWEECLEVVNVLTEDEAFAVLGLPGDHVELTQRNRIAKEMANFRLLIENGASISDIAYKIAELGHCFLEGCQYDYAEVCKIDHIRTVGRIIHVDEAIAVDETVAVAYLHDTLEDTLITADDLRTAGISEDVIKAVIAITKTEDTNYFQYIKDVKENSLSRVVKIADLKHNMDLTRLPVITEKDVTRQAKYVSALAQLLDVKISQDTNIFR